MRSPYWVEETRQEVFVRTFGPIRRPNGIREPERLAGAGDALRKPYFWEAFLHVQR